MRFIVFLNNMINLVLIFVILICRCNFFISMFFKFSISGYIIQTFLLSMFIIILFLLLFYRFSIFDIIIFLLFYMFRIINSLLLCYLLSMFFIIQPLLLCYLLSMFFIIQPLLLCYLLSIFSIIQPMLLLLLLFKVIINIKFSFISKVSNRIFGIYVVLIRVTTIFPFVISFSVHCNYSILWICSTNFLF